MIKNSFSPKFILLSLGVLLLNNELYAQKMDMTRPAADGIFVYFSNELTTGKSTELYSLERKIDKSFEKVADIKSPSSWDEFKNRLDSYKNDFSFVVLPNTETLKKLWEKAMLAGTVDSMYMWATSPLIRLASGTAFYDKTAPKEQQVSYKLTIIGGQDKKPKVYESIPVKWPIYLSFDSIKFEEKSIDKTFLYIKWKSSGAAPARNFKVMFYENKQLVESMGLRNTYKVNNNTYYVFQDSIKKAFTNRQYFMVPIDQLGNIGNSSSILMVSSSESGKIFFKSTKARTAKDILGVSLTWALNNNRDIDKYDIYRSSSFDSGFVKIATIPATDTTYTDIKVEPDKFYYYYLSASDKNGITVSESTKFFDIGKDPLKPNPPIINYAMKIPGGIELKISVSDLNLSGIRIYRKKDMSNNFIAVSGLIPLKKGNIVWKDTSEIITGNQTFVYVARTENTSSLQSDNSQEALATSGKINRPKAVTRLKAYEENKKVNLVWDNLANAENSYIKGYIVYRRELPSGKFKPVYPKDSVNKSNMFTDSLIMPGTKYEYAVRTLDLFGGMSENLTVTGIQTSKPIVDSPKGVNIISVKEGNLLSWSKYVSQETGKIKVYRYQRGQKPSLLATLASSEAEYTDKSVKKGELYFYYLIFVNNENQESGSSEEVSIR